MVERPYSAVVEEVIERPYCVAAEEAIERPCFAVAEVAEVADGAAEVAVGGS